MVLVWGTSMSEAVRTMASTAAVWAIVVASTALALFMALVAMVVDLRVARTQRMERKFGIEPESGSPLAMAAGSRWPRLSEALLAAAGVRRSEAAKIRESMPAADTATRDDIPAQREETAPYAAEREAEREAEPPTVPIPAQRAHASQGTRDAADTPTRPDLPAQGAAPGRPAARPPEQRTGESDRAERSFAGPTPQDDDENER